MFLVVNLVVDNRQHIKHRECEDGVPSRQPAERPYSFQVLLGRCLNWEL